MCGICGITRNKLCGQNEIIILPQLCLVGICKPFTLSVRFKWMLNGVYDDDGTHQERPGLGFI